MAVSLERAAQEATLFLSPLPSYFDSPENALELFRRLGYDPSLGSLGNAAPGLQALGEEINTLVERAMAYAAARAEGTASPQELAALADGVRGAFDALRALPGQLDVGQLAATFFSDLFELLLVDYLSAYRPALLHLLALLGVLELEFVPPGEGSAAVGFTRARFDWQRLPRFVQDPKSWAEEVYGWGTETFEHDRLLARLSSFADAAGAWTTLVRMSHPLAVRFFPSAAANPILPLAVKFPFFRAELDEVVTEVGLMGIPVEGVQAPAATDTGLGVVPYAEGAVEGTRAINDTLDLIYKGSVALAGGLAFAVRPHSGLEASGGGSTVATDVGELRVELRRKPPTGSGAFAVLGDPDGSRLEAAAVLFAVGGQLDDFYVAVGAEELRLLIDPSGDGLLSRLVPEPIEIDVGDVVAGWRQGRGIYFEKGAGLSLRIPLAVGIGGLRVHALAADITLKTETKLSITIDADASIGPLFLGVAGLGLEATLVPGEGGLLGKADLAIGPRFPTGYAAALDGGPISGGGALIAEPDGYKGALALSFQSFEFSAFALLTTRMPSGEPGFSFLATMFGEFNMPLGLGFRLTGLGGIIGIDRTSNVEALRQVLLEGRLDGILFPSDPIEDVTTILADLADVFPPRAGQHLFGPMVRLGWGTPILIEVKLGIILEVGAQARTLILGSLGTALPSRDAAIVILRTDFIGVIDFATGSVAFDGTLTGSRILTWPCAGEFAYRSGWGPSTGLLASAGGLHPQFPVPAGFPTLQRLMINFGTDNPRITLSAYMAVALSSVQAGALVNLYVRGPDVPFVGRLEVIGWASFDALIHFEPFRFDAALGLSLKLMIDGEIACGIVGDIRLTGPNGYELRGKVWAIVCGIELTVKIQQNWGVAVEEQLTSADGLALLTAALHGAAFEPVQPSSRTSGATFQTIEAEADGATSRIDPGGGLRLVQRALPLGIRLERIGNARPSGGIRTFDLEVTEAGERFEADPVMGEFVRAHFFDMSDGDKLRAPAMESFKAGVGIDTGEGLQSDAAAGVDVDIAFETVVLGGAEHEAEVVASAEPAPETLRRWVASNVATVATPRNPRFHALVAEPIRLRPAAFTTVPDPSAPGPDEEHLPRRVAQYLVAR